MQFWAKRRAAKALAVVLLLLLLPHRKAQAFTLSDVGVKLTEVTGLRGIAKGISGGIGDGISESFRKGAGQLIDEKINPLLDRVDAIMKSNIIYAADQAMRLLQAAETALNDVITNAHAAADEVVERLFNRLRRQLDDTVAQVRSIIDNALCAVAPGQDGLRISGLPFVTPFAEIEVATPARTQCYANFLAGQGDPESAKFSGYQYFYGELCEFEVILNRIDPADPKSISKMARAYEQLAGMAKQGMCSAPTENEKHELMTRELAYEGRAAFFRAIESGASTIFSDHNRERGSR